MFTHKLQVEARFEYLGQQAREYLPSQITAATLMLRRDLRRLWKNAQEPAPMIGQLSLPNFPRFFCLFSSIWQEVQSGMDLSQLQRRPPVDSPERPLRRVLGTSDTPSRRACDGGCARVAEVVGCRVRPFAPAHRHHRDLFAILIPLLHRHRDCYQHWDPHLVKAEGEPLAVAVAGAWMVKVAAAVVAAAVTIILSY